MLLNIIDSKPKARKTTIDKSYNVDKSAAGENISIHISKEQKPKGGKSRKISHGDQQQQQQQQQQPRQDSKLSKKRKAANKPASSSTEAAAAVAASKRSRPDPSSDDKPHQQQQKRVLDDKKRTPVKSSAPGPAAGTTDTPDWSNVADCLLDEVPDVVQLFEEQLDMETPTAESEKIFSKLAIKDCKDIHPYLVSLLTDKLGLQYFTRVQADTLPLVLSGRDVLIKTQTGSGKSLALLLPLVQQLQSAQPPLTRSSGLQALVLCPTRELAEQSHRLLQQLLRPFVRIVSGQLVGGVKRKAQKAALRKGLNVVVATPHRLLDHLRSSSRLDLASCLRMLVIDEADRLAELGYERDVRLIVEAVCAGGRRPQTLLCSATLGSGTERLAGLALVDPASVSETAPLPDSVRYHVLAAPTRARLRALLAALRALLAAGHKAAVFLPTQASVDFHHALLSSLLSDSVPLCRLHGNVAHAERMAAFRSFADLVGSGLLISTDVSARGLDLSRLSWVVQGPGEPEIFCHRAGRTARLGRPGRCLLVLDAGHAAGFLRLLCDAPVTPAGLRFAPVPADKLLARYCPENFAQLVGMVSDDPDLRAAAEDAFVSTVRALASFSGDLRAALPMPHLGHLAASFCLSDAPGVVAKNVRDRRHGGAEEKQQDKKIRKLEGKPTSKVSGGQRVRQNTSVRQDRMSEFASGI